MQILFENENHHNGSLYCVDWSRSQRLIASGSNDREIKILVTPNLENEEVLNQLLVLVLKGHTAIVRTVCFDPSNDLVLLSGGLSKISMFIFIDDTDVKVWNSETGKNVSSLKGHQGSIYSIKMTADGSYAMSVGTDKYIRIWDVRAKSHVAAIDGTAYGDMNEIAFYQYPSLDQGVESSMGGLACVGHTDGSLTFWDIGMRKC